ncbi:sulfotransferase domain-containing protein [Caulobacter rhizosphaerae]|jgi:hypothetical protein|uniref:sulfotransferase domain-containing protein n=1 Tax=Caulobacter rhizosphaerae TaxID=2010972 RepID=UPI0013D5C662|nr:sulfotransferase domain-containing protein [Caulobacter rhizosphaerae]GGL41590.1 sulfotransferase [Caulobacter rhizosphaerae]
MIVWLASFPRSGNTLLRSVLRGVFGLETFSKYEPAGSPSMDQRLTDLIGVTKYEGDFGAFSTAAREADDLRIIKTHDGPEGLDKAIYVVRDGLVATDSYRHYRTATEGRQVSWLEVLAADRPFDNWSLHLDAWRPLERPETLLVRYEDLVGAPETEIGRIAAFLGRPALNRWVDPWETVNNIGPNFFRRGKADRPASITSDEAEAFMALHGEWMGRLGY